MEMISGLRLLNQLIDIHLQVIFFIGKKGNLFLGNIKLHLTLILNHLFFCGKVADFIRDCL